MPWKDDSKAAQRRRLVLAMVNRAGSVVELCRQAGVSRQTAYKYRRRFEQSGWEGMQERSRRNGRGSRYVVVRERILALRLERPSWGARQLLYQQRRAMHGLRLPCERLVQLWLEAAGLVQRRRRKQAGAGLGRQMPPARSSNGVWTVDIKGWFETLGGAKVQPLTVRDHYSKCVLCVQPVSSLGEKVLHRIFTGLFRRYGRPRAILTDRGVPFCSTGPYGLTRLSLWWHRLGIEVLFVDRKRGIHNNAHEQMHRILKKEVRVMRTLREQSEELERWRCEYNTVRAHQTIGRPPAMVYRPRPGPLPRLRSPRYPSGWPVLTVKSSGHILFRGQLHVVGRAFAGQRVGLQPTGPHLFQAFFGSLPIVQLTRNPIPKREGA